MTSIESIKDSLEQIKQQADYGLTDLRGVEEIQEDRDAWKAKAEEWEEKYNDAINENAEQSDTIDTLNDQVSELHETIEELKSELKNQQ